jgi:hypothetical protein
MEQRFYRTTPFDPELSWWHASYRVSPIVPMQ